MRRPLVLKSQSILRIHSQLSFENQSSPFLRNLLVRALSASASSASATPVNESTCAEGSALAEGSPRAEGSPQAESPARAEGSPCAEGAAWNWISRPAAREVVRRAVAGGGGVAEGEIGWGKLLGGPALEVGVRVSGKGLPRRIVVVHGPRGVGKRSLLEAPNLSTAPPLDTVTPPPQPQLSSLRLDIESALETLVLCAIRERRLQSHDLLQALQRRVHVVTALETLLSGGIGGSGGRNGEERGRCEGRQVEELWEESLQLVQGRLQGQQAQEEQQLAQEKQQQAHLQSVSGASAPAAAAAASLCEGADFHDALLLRLLEATARGRDAAPRVLLCSSDSYYSDQLSADFGTQALFHPHELFGWLPEEASVHLVPSTFTPLQWRVVEAAIGSNPRHLAEFHSLWAGWREEEDEFERVDSCIDHYLAYLHATEVEPAMQAALTHLERFGEQLASGEQPRWAARFGSPWGNAPGTWGRRWVEWREGRRGRDRVKWIPEFGYGINKGDVHGRQEALQRDTQGEKESRFTKEGEVPEEVSARSGKEEEEEEEGWMEEEEKGEYRRQLREWARFQMMDFVYALATAEFGVNYGKDSGEEFMEDPAAAALLKVGLLYQQRDPMYVRPTSVAFQRCLTRWLVNEWLRLDRLEMIIEVELVRLREANVRLEAEVSRLRDKSDRLEGERRRLSARLAAVHTAMQQLEREAAIRSRTRAEATMGAQQKGWNRWFSGDPSAMERVLETAEDARVERAAAAATVEKLVEENARLVQQMNEQKLLIANLVTTMRTTTIPGTPAGVPASSQGMHAGLSPVLTQPLPAHATSAAGRTSAAAAAVVEDNSPSSSSAHSQLSFPTSSLSTPPASSHELPFTGRSAAAALAALPVRATSASEYTLTADVAGLGSVDQAALAGGVGGTQGRVPVAQMSQNVQDESSRSPSPRPTALHPSAPFPAATNGGSYTATEQAFPVARDGGFQTATGTASGAAREDSRDSHGTFLTANGPSAFLQSAHSSSSSLAADASLLLPVVRSAPPPSAALCAQQPTPTLSESSSRYPAIWPVTYSERELEGAGGGGGEGGVEGGGGAVALTVGNGTVGDVRARGMVDEAGSVVAAGSGAGGVGLVGAGEIAVRGAGGVERNEVSLIDSPLVGAPFRLAFFLVKVVSKTGIVQRLAGRLVGGRNKDLGAGGETQNVNVDGGVGSSVGML
ncbi:unnamed protein product [Closterium sp. NIES-64]|nr:unnamed protein product [Closterium sp. NIES-64]